MPLRQGASQLCQRGASFGHCAVVVHYLGRHLHYLGRYAAALTAGLPKVTYLVEMRHYRGSAVGGFTSV